MISLIVAHDQNLLIGKDNKMPWHYPEDLKYFKETTLGKNVLMGRNTYDSIMGYLGKPLPNRTTHVLTRKEALPMIDSIFHSVEEVIEHFEDSEEELFVAGGKQVYEAMLPYADRLYITMIHKTFEGDTHFPSYKHLPFKKIFQTDTGDLSFVVYERVK